MHYFNEILYFIDGDVDYVVETEKKHLAPGDIVFIQPGKYHFAIVNKNVLYERYVIKFPDEIIPSVIYPRLKKIPAFFQNMRSFEHFFKEFDNFYETLSEEDVAVVFTCLTVEILTFLLRCNSSEKYVPANINSAITRIIRYIDENLSRHLTLETMARELNYSESYISNTFKDEMKCPIIQYIRSKKIIMSHSMIEQGGKPQVVAEIMGFEDYSTFYRSYLKIIGTPPSTVAKRKVP